VDSDTDDFNPQFRPLHTVWIISTDRNFCSLLIVCFFIINRSFKQLHCEFKIPFLNKFHTIESFDWHIENQSDLRLYTVK
jgi:hypothetical protein